MIVWFQIPVTVGFEEQFLVSTGIVWLLNCHDHTLDFDLLSFYLKELTVLSLTSGVLCGQFTWAIQPTCFCCFARLFWLENLRLQNIKMWLPGNGFHPPPCRSCYCCPCGSCYLLTFLSWLSWDLCSLSLGGNSWWEASPYTYVSSVCIRVPRAPSAAAVPSGPPQALRHTASASARCLFSASTSV